MEIGKMDRDLLFRELIALGHLRPPIDQEQVAKDAIRGAWKDLRNGQGTEQLYYFRGFLDALVAVEIISHDDREMYTKASHSCPGHDDEDGRAWCSYGCKL